MDKKMMITASKLLLIIGIIFCGLAIIMPWGVFSAFSIDIFEYYNWGTHVLFGPNINPWTFYYWGFVGPGMSLSSETAGLAAITVFLYLVFPYSVLSLIGGIIALRFLDRKYHVISLVAAIFSILAITFFVIFIQFGILSIPGMDFFGEFSYGVGIIMTIIAIILFCVVYVLQKTYYVSGLQKS